MSSIVYGNDLNEALLEASRNGNIVEVKSLIKKGANVNSKNTSVDTSVVSTALMEASQSGHLEVVKYLVENGADINATDDGGSTALMMASWYGHLKVVKYLVENGANINTKDNIGYTALMYASRRGKLKVVEYLTPKIVKQAEKGNLEEIKQYLVENGADINTIHLEVWTALSLASGGGHLEVVKYLESLSNR